VSKVIVGMDPHKNSATIEVMAGDEAVVHRPPDRGVAPEQGVRQAGHQLPPRTRPGPEKKGHPFMTGQRPGEPTCAFAA
jgi:hypothetical protein